MAALSGCKLTAHATNMIDPNNRIDLYSGIVENMNEYLDYDEEVNRDLIKIPIVSH